MLPIVKRLFAVCGALAAVAVTAGCAAATRGPGASNDVLGAANRALSAEASGDLSDSKKATLYYSDTAANLVGIVDGETYQQVGTIGGFQQVGGLATDVDGNLYVADTAASQILVFHGRKTIPFKSIAIPSNPYRVRVAENGTLAAPGPCCSYGIIYYFHKGATKVSGTLQVPDGPNVTGLAFDKHDNLYVGALFNGSASVERFIAPYKTAPSALPAQVSQPYSEAFDARGHLVVADFAQGVEVFKLTGATPISQFDEGSAPFEIIFDRNHTRAFVGRNNPQKGVDVYRYPSEEFVTTILQHPAVNVDDLAFGPAPSP